jgi:hypothetical protein
MLTQRQRGEADLASKQGRRLRRASEHTQGRCAHQKMEYAQRKSSKVGCDATPLWRSKAAHGRFSCSHCAFICCFFKLRPRNARNKMLDPPERNADALHQAQGRIRRRDVCPIVNGTRERRDNRGSAGSARCGLEQRRAPQFPHLLVAAAARSTHRSPHIVGKGSRQQEPSPKKGAFQAATNPVGAPRKKRRGVCPLVEQRRRERLWQQPQPGCPRRLAPPQPAGSTIGASVGASVKKKRVGNPEAPSLDHGQGDARMTDRRTNGCALLHQQEHHDEEALISDAALQQLLERRTQPRVLQYPGHHAAAQQHQTMKRLLRAGTATQRSGGSQQKAHVELQPPRWAAAETCMKSTSGGRRLRTISTDLTNR